MMIVIQMSLGIKLKQFVVSYFLREKKKKTEMTMFSVSSHTRKVASTQSDQKRGQNMIVKIREIPQVKGLRNNQVLIEINHRVEVGNVMKIEDEVGADQEIKTEIGAEVDQEMGTGRGAEVDQERDKEIEKGAAAKGTEAAVIDQEAAATDQVVAVTQSGGEVQLLL